MAAKIQKKNSVNITAILDIAEDDLIHLEVEDLASPILLADLMKDFNGKEVKITVDQSEDIV